MQTFPVQADWALQDSNRVTEALVIPRRYENRTEQAVQDPVQIPRKRPRLAPIWPR